MADRASILVHGATGFTGKLVCAALRRRGILFAIAGRSDEKLRALSAELGGVEVARVDITDSDALARAISGRALVCACAGPFVDVGEPVLATCARAGVHYVDTTGEQAFAAMAFARYHAAAEASGACIVPAMGLEIAPADWGAHVVAQRLGVAPEAIDICYTNKRATGANPVTTRGTKRSVVRVVASDDALQFVDGALVSERSAAVVRRFPTRDGGEVTAASFPSPEAFAVPSHTGARTVRTFMAMAPFVARAMQLGRAVAPVVARLVKSRADRAIARGPEGPDAGEREASTFAIFVEARAPGDRVARAWVTGRDPYGLTGEIQAWAAARAVGGKIRARGVVAPSVAYPAADAFAELAFTGMKLEE
jgi:short subunit dehydrogenase-like uncharacterized protein